MTKHVLYKYCICVYKYSIIIEQIFVPFVCSLKLKYYLIKERQLGILVQKCQGHFSLIYKNFLWSLPCYRYMYSSRFLVLKQKLPSRVKWLKNRSPKCKYLHFSLSLSLYFTSLSLSFSLFFFLIAGW